jgi:hypothetical protein
VVCLLNPPVLLLSPRLPVPELEWARWSPDEELPSVRVSTGGGPKRGIHNRVWSAWAIFVFKAITQGELLGPKGEGRGARQSRTRACVSLRLPTSGHESRLLTLEFQDPTEEASFCAFLVVQGARKAHNRCLLDGG